MIHFSCDLCGQHLGDRRFAVKLEVYAAFDPEEFDKEDLDVDNLQEVADMIQEMENAGHVELEDVSPKQFRFDLCSKCHRTFINDPLGRETLGRLNFSEN